MLVSPSHGNVRSLLSPTCTGSPSLHSRTGSRHTLGILAAAKEGALSEYVIEHGSASARSPTVSLQLLAGAAGIEPANAGTKNRCLTAWLRRSEEHTSELQSLMRISYAVFCLKKKKNI